VSLSGGGHYRKKLNLTGLNCADGQSQVAPKASHPSLETNHPS
jgi:hypothetical protein